ncbi:hypothetical protein AAHE18_02G102000 [Arachis hypogaea]
MLFFIFFLEFFSSKCENPSCQTYIKFETTQRLFRSAHVNILVGMILFSIFPFGSTIRKR